jgi:hypothetical protein
MGRWWLAPTLLLAAGLSLVPAPAWSVRVGDRSPEITGDRWINSPPLSLAALRGRVVLVEFWTFG